MNDVHQVAELTALSTRQKCAERVGNMMLVVVSYEHTEVAVKRLRRKEGAAFTEKDIRAFEEEVAVMRCALNVRARGRLSCAI